MYVLIGMPKQPLWSIEALTPQGLLRAFEPTRAEISAAAPDLARFNNDSHNAAMMTNTRELTAADIVDFYQALWDDGGRPFLLEYNGILMGDADFRNVIDGDAEFAMMIGARNEQSRCGTPRTASNRLPPCSQLTGHPSPQTHS